MKSCLYPVEIANAEMGLYWLWHLLLVLLLEETVHSTTVTVCKIQLVMRVCKHYPMLALHIAGLGFRNGKSVIVMRREIIRGK